MTLGGLDGVDILSMSGGWGQSFNLADASTVTIAFDYMLEHAANFESSETVDALMSIDGGAATVLASLTGDGDNNGPSMTTGWQSFEVAVNLDAGAHTLDIGAFLNKKTGSNEVSDAYFDNVVVTTNSGAVASDTYDFTGVTYDVTVDLATQTLTSAPSGTVQLAGYDNVIGGSGNDTILASNAVNVIAGGPGNDSFVFRTLEEAGTSAATRDQVTDFQPGDTIDVAAIDANSFAAGNQSFNLIFDAPTFTAAGEIKFRHETQADGDHTILEGNVDGDPEADFQIDLAGWHDLKASDFAGAA